MDESERLQRYERAEDDREDRKFSDRIALLLNHPKIDKYCMVDAYYYDFSVIPYEIQQSNNFYRDMYMIFGITTEGQAVTKWVERYDLDSDYALECTCRSLCRRQQNDLQHSYSHLNAELKPLSDGEDPPAEIPERRVVNVNGREEHEAIIQDAAKCRELGLDQVYETIVYLSRWGGWLGQ
jgi:hypothetical protein